MGQLFKCIVEVLMNHGSYEGGGGGEVVLVEVVALAFRAPLREDLVLSSTRCLTQIGEYL